MKYRAAIGVVLAVWSASAARAQTTPLSERVLILVNEKMPAEAGTNRAGASAFVGRYYAQKRGIPEGHILHLRTTTEEWIPYADYLAEIESPVRKLLDANNGAMGHAILYIVPVYGIPIKVQMPDGQLLSTDSLLSVLYATPATAIRIRNPYFGAVGSRPPHFAEWADQRQAAGGGKMFLVSRLDGPSASIARGLVDQAVTAEAALDTKSGIGYFDYQGSRATSDPMSPFDIDMQQAGTLSQKHGFRTVMHAQAEAVCRVMIHPASAHYYDRAAKGVSVSSYGVTP